MTATIGWAYVSKGTKRLVREMEALIEVAEDVRKVLQRYKTGSTKLAARVDLGELLADALKAESGPMRRREVSDALAELEAARHRVRLAMFALGEEQGTSASELGRQLAISRQLSSRLAAEAREILG